MKRARFTDLKNQTVDSENTNEDIIKGTIRASVDTIVTRNLMADSNAVYVPKIDVGDNKSSDDLADDGHTDDLPVDNTVPNELNTYNSDPIIGLFDNNKYDTTHNTSVNHKSVSNDEPVGNIPDKQEDLHANESVTEHRVTMILPGSGSVSAVKSDNNTIESVDTSEEIVSLKSNSESQRENDDLAGDLSFDESDVSSIDNDDYNGEYTPSNVRIVKSKSSVKPRSICDDDGDFYVARVYKFPKNVLNYICDQFDFSSCGKNIPAMGHILAAYIFIKEGYPDDMPIPQKVSDVVDMYKGTYTVSNSDIQEKLLTAMDRFNAEFNNIRQMLRSDIMKKLSAIEMISLYDVFRQMNFSLQDNVGSPEEVNFQEQGMAEMQRSLERQVVSKLEKDKIDNGHDIYNAKYKESH